MKKPFFLFHEKPKRPALLLCCLFLIIFMASVALIGMSAFSHDSSGDSWIQSTTSEGDSIFYETMVDMTWQEVEKASLHPRCIGE